MKQQSLELGECASHNEMPVPPIELIRTYPNIAQQEALIEVPLSAEVENYPISRPEIEEV